MNQTDTDGPVFVMYPQGQVSGGPEALHQLVRELINQGVEAYLTPMPGTHGVPRAEQFDRYDCPVAEHPRDARGSRIVVPEINISELRGVTQASTYVWWLSIDNSPLFADERLLSRSPTSAHVYGEIAAEKLRRTASSMLGHTSTLRRQRGYLRRASHLTQSAYAWSYLYVRHGVSAHMLSDFTNHADFSPEAWASMAERGRTVAFNPAKGADLIAELQRRRPEVEWLPIRGMDRRQVVDLLNGTAIYLDLGHHPGKDRIPREAALAGAITVVLRRGSGGFVDDVPIPEDHKVSAFDPVGDAMRVLDRLFADPASARAAQDDYRNIIRREASTFSSEVRDVFVNGRREGGARPLSVT